MNNYELTFTISPDMAEFEAQKVEAKIHGSITKQGGNIISHNFWGKHELAYPIQKHEFGYFATAVFALPPDSISGLTDEIRLIPEIIRHLLISLNKEKIKLEDLKRMELFREQPTTSRVSTAKPRPASIRTPIKPKVVMAPRKDEATRLKELDEKLGDILDEPTKDK